MVVSSSELVNKCPRGLELERIFPTGRVVTSGRTGVTRGHASGVLLMDQSGLPSMPEPIEPPAAQPTRPGEARLVRPVRNQIEWTPRELDSVLPPDHPARAIWAFLERSEVDLSPFYASIKAVADRPCRPASDPQVLLAIRTHG